VSRTTPGQVRAFSVACYVRGLDAASEKAAAAARTGTPFADFSFEQMNAAITAVNAKPRPDFEKRVANFEQRRQEACEEEARANAEVMTKWNAAFGDDFERTILPIVYAVRKPANREWIRSWNALFALPTLEQRRAALFALLGEWLGLHDLANLEPDRREHLDALDLLREMTEEAR
jgi:hypothetical protein